MKAVNVADKLVSISKICILAALIALPLNAQAEYFLVYSPQACDSCQSSRTYYRPVYKVHKVHKVYKVAKTKPCQKKYYRTVTRKRNHYNITVYYPVPITQSCTTCCGGCGFIAPTYAWVPAPYKVYYTHPNDRLVGNGYDDNYHDPSLDTGTADNDIY